MKENTTREAKDRQIRREARATAILFAICFIWHASFAYGLSGTGIRLAGIPLWWIVSTPGVFLVAVAGVIYLLRNVFTDIELEDEGGDGNDR